MRNRDKRPISQASLATSTKAPFVSLADNSATERFSFCETCSPIHLARLFRCGWRKFSEAVAILGDRDLLTMLDPFGEPGEIVTQLADCCGSHL